MTDSLMVPLGRLSNNTKYYWRVKAMNYGGSGPYSEVFNFRTLLLGLETSESEAHLFRLHQNHPNPFNSMTKIRFEIPKDEFVKLIVYDMLGREVLILLNKNLKSGSYSVTLDATNYATGPYFYRLAAGNYLETRKMLVVK